MAALPTQRAEYDRCYGVSLHAVDAAEQISVNRNQIQIKSVEGDLWDQTEVNVALQGRGMCAMSLSVASRAGRRSRIRSVSYKLNGGVSTNSPARQQRDVDESANPNTAAVSRHGVHPLDHACEVESAGLVLCGHGAPGAIVGVVRWRALGLLHTLI